MDILRNSDFAFKAVRTWCCKDREDGARGGGGEMIKKDRGRGKERPLIEHLLDTRNCDSCFRYTLSLPAAL